MSISTVIVFIIDTILHSVCGGKRSNLLSYDKLRKFESSEAERASANGEGLVFHCIAVNVGIDDKFTVFLDHQAEFTFGIGNKRGYDVTVLGVDNFTFYFCKRLSARCERSGNSSGFDKRNLNVYVGFFRTHCKRSFFAFLAEINVGAVNRYAKHFSFRNFVVCSKHNAGIGSYSSLAGFFVKAEQSVAANVYNFVFVAFHGEFAGDKFVCKLACRRLSCEDPVVFKIDTQVVADGDTKADCSDALSLLDVAVIERLHFFKQFVCRAIFRKTCSSV